MDAAAHIDDLIPALVLGALEPGEEHEARLHLQACMACTAEYQAYLDLTGKMAAAAPQVEPPPRLRMKLLAVARQAQKLPRKQPAWLEDLTGIFRKPGTMWMAASLAVILLLAVGNLYQWQSRQPATVPSADYHFSVVSMHGSDPALKAEGILVISPDGRYGTLVVDGLQPLVAGQAYQLWLIVGDSRVSGGVFGVGASGYGALKVDAPRPLSEYNQFGITIEPVGGSPQPTGERVLGGEL